MSRLLPENLHTLPGPDDVTRAQLPNGIVILARQNFSSPSVTIGGYLPAGALFDTDEKLGLADFTAAALMRGTRGRTFQQLHDALESAGATLSFSGGTHTTGFFGRALAEDLPLLLSLLGEALREPAFPPQEVERLRTQLLTALAIRAQDTADMASLAFDKLIFAGHPYARPEDGYPRTIKAIEHGDLLSFHARHYGPRGVVIAIVGAVEPERAVEAVDRVMGGWRNDDQPAAPPLPALRRRRTGRRKDIFLPGKSQTDILIGCAGPERRAPDYLAASLGNSILGQFGMMGRIGDVVRERSGLAYYAHSSLSAGIGPGSWEVSAGVNPANVEKTIALIVAELERFVGDVVSAEELADSQANFIGRLPLSLESNNGVANGLLNLERHGLGLDYYQRYPAMIQAVTREDVLAAARHYLKVNALCVATAGGSADETDHRD